MTVKSEHDSSFDFSRLTTYAWQPRSERTPVTPRVDGDFLDEALKREVDDILQRKGYRADSGQPPDFVVTYRATVKTKLDESKSNEPYGYSSGWWGPSGDVGHVPADPGADYAREYDVGQLTLAALDPASGKAVWQGTVRTEVYLYASKQERAARIREAAERILERFPPR